MFGKIEIRTFKVQLIVDKYLNPPNLKMSPMTTCLFRKTYMNCGLNSDDLIV